MLEKLSKFFGVKVNWCFREGGLYKIDFNLIWKNKICIESWENA